MKQQESIGKWISATFRYMKIYIDKEFKKYSIGSGQFQILIVLDKNDGINQESISKILNLDKANVTRAVTKLEKKNYVRRVIDPNDHRAYILHLTQSGKKLVPKIRKSLTKLSSKLLSDFSIQEKDLALKLLKRMYQNMTTMESQ
jgi:DNA-binding MarR family transcriptional regulator